MSKEVNKGPRVFISTGPVLLISYFGDKSEAQLVGPSSLFPLLIHQVYIIDLTGKNIRIAYSKY